MVRIVRTTQGDLEVDSTAKRPGRGAYLCTNPSCRQQLPKQNRIEYVLRGKINRESLKELSIMNNTETSVENGAL